MNASFQFAAGRRATVFIENHDHATVTARLGGRGLWWRAQPWMIALFTAPATPLLHNGQEWGQVESLPEQDSPGDPRVAARPLHWGQATDAVGTLLRGIFDQLISMRRDHPGLRATNFYPQDWQLSTRDGDGFGVDEALGLCVYHRWGPGAGGLTEYFIVALNFSAYDRAGVLLTFPFEASWKDLLSSDTVAGTRASVTVTSNWGRVFWAQR